MSKFYYRLLIDSPTGRLLTAFWHSCVSVERLAEKYAKRMGGEYYYSDPKYFAGGVIYISFPNNKPTDPMMWREVGIQHEDGSFIGVRDERYPECREHLQKGDVVYFQPNVNKRLDWVEVDGADFQPTNTFDTIYNPPAVLRRDDKGVEHYMMQCLKYEYDEPPGRSANGLRTASQTVRRAIKAEQQRCHLPVMKVEPLLKLLGAVVPVPEQGKPKSVDMSTPTFFAYEEHYYIGCNYECEAEGLRSISQQTHRTYQCKAENAAKHSS